MQFTKILKERHGVGLKLCGSRSPVPDFDSKAGAWSKPSRASTCLVLLDQIGDVLTARLPRSQNGELRLGQINHANLPRPLLLGFTLMVALRGNSSWDLTHHSWNLVFRLPDSEKARLESRPKMRGSSVAYWLNPDDGKLKAQASGLELKINYAKFGILMNSPRNEALVDGNKTYGQATDAISTFLTFSRAG